MAELYNFPKKLTKKEIENDPDAAVLNFLLTKSDKQIEKFLDDIVILDVPGLSIDRIDEYLHEEMGYKGEAEAPSVEMRAYLVDRCLKSHGLEGLPL